MLTKQEDKYVAPGAGGNLSNQGLIMLLKGTTAEALVSSAIIEGCAIWKRVILPSHLLRLCVCLHSVDIITLRLL